ncbi:hypothetical protein HELRODRAFT_76443, partial [Helobdella robusta]|uniref:Protein kinase domain-containing protein n=1 Tax=Helobdella robusta TaxID=6412 RepID=T1G2J9_HELRO
CVKLWSSFDYFGCCCLEFELLDVSVFEFMKNNSFQAYSLSQVKHMGQQLLTALQFLHDRNIIHTNVRPESVMFVDSSYDVIVDPSTNQSYNNIKNTSIRLAHFESAVRSDSSNNMSVISARQYKAIEVLLELGWGNKCDIWSLACVLFEFYTADTLFQSHSNLEHLAMMEATLGTIPSHICLNSKKPKLFLNGRLRWDHNSKEGRYVLKNSKPLKTYAKANSEDDVNFMDLLRCMLNYDACNRYTASEALRHHLFL